MVNCSTVNVRNVVSYHSLSVGDFACFCVSELYQPIVCACGYGASLGLQLLATIATSSQSFWLQMLRFFCQ